MEKNTNLSSSSQTTTAPIQGFGKALQQAREKKKISLDDVAKELFILKRHLQAIEAEDYTALPQQTFARGFVVNYAKFLGVDSNAIAQSFDANYPAHLKTSEPANISAPMQPISTLQRESRGKIKLNPLFIIGLLLALGLGIFAFKTINKAHNETQPSEATPQPSIITPQDQATGASLSSTAVAPATNSSNTGLSNTGSAIGNAGVAIPTTTSAVASTQGMTIASTNSTATTGAGELEFWVQNNTNVTVTDATGAVLVQGEKTRGGFTLHGQPPFNINIDKASNVKLNFNKEPIKLDQYAQNNQANFTLK